MNINFDTDRFKNDPRGLIDVLSNLYRVGSWSLGHHRDIEEIVCRTPSIALKFCHLVNHAYGVSKDAEKVFVKNPSIGIRYLRLVGRSEFLEEKVQRRFWRKVLKSPDLALEWARTFGRRLPEGEEVFVKSICCARDYSFYVIRGAFPENIHRMFVLRSFENLDSRERGYLTEYLQYAESSSKKRVANGH
jgi:hypothetical protein